MTASEPVQLQSLERRCSEIPLSAFEILWMYRNGLVGIWPKELPYCLTPLLKTVIHGSVELAY